MFPWVVWKSLGFLQVYFPFENWRKPTFQSPCLEKEVVRYHRIIESIRCGRDHEDHLVPGMPIVWTFRRMNPCIYSCSRFLTSILHLAITVKWCLNTCANYPRWPCFAGGGVGLDDLCMSLPNSKVLWLPVQFPMCIRRQYHWGLQSHLHVLNQYRAGEEKWAW